MATTSRAHHEAASAFPMMDAGRFAELRADIETHGLREPITLCDDKILDGRNRYKACSELGIEPHSRLYQGDPWAYVWSLNGQRRDLSEDQRAQIFIHVAKQSDHWQTAREEIATAANAKRSKTQKGVPKAEAKERAATKCSGTFADEHKTQNAKASAAGVNAGAIARAEALERKRPDLAEKVRIGEVKPAEARRQAKRDEVANKAEALPDGTYTVFYADPPWQYGDGRTGDRITATGALHHYPTMTLAELKALDIAGRAAENSVLFLWATSPLLPDALDLCRAWGFAYKASFVWDKVKHNMGHYNSVRHEFL